MALMITLEARFYSLRYTSIKFTNCDMAMLHRKEKIEMANRHVSQGTILVVRQQRILEEMRLAGHHTKFAEKVLELLQSTQLQREIHLCRISK